MLEIVKDTWKIMDFLITASIEMGMFLSRSLDDWGMQESYMWLNELESIGILCKQMLWTLITWDEQRFNATSVGGGTNLIAIKCGTAIQLF